jgi:hypothetical protein
MPEEQLLFIPENKFSFSIRPFYEKSAPVAG